MDNDKSKGITDYVMAINYLLFAAILMCRLSRMWILYKIFRAIFNAFNITYIVYFIVDIMISLYEEINK